MYICIYTCFQILLILPSHVVVEQVEAGLPGQCDVELTHSQQLLLHLLIGKSDPQWKHCGGLGRNLHQLLWQVIVVPLPQQSVDDVNGMRKFEASLNTPQYTIPCQSVHVEDNFCTISKTFCHDSPPGHPKSSPKTHHDTYQRHTMQTPNTHQTYSKHETRTPNMPPR